MYNPLRYPDDAEPWPIPTTQGGPIGPRDHVGHIDEFEAVMAAVGPGQVGALCMGDRRMGKTSLIRLVEEVLRRDGAALVLSVSAETSHPAVFATRLREAVLGTGWLGSEVRKWEVDVDVTYKGIRLRRSRGGKAPDGDDDLLVFAAAKARPHRLVVMIDEIAVLAAALAKGDPDNALEFLRSLRRARQEADNLAVVLSGSIGLHHVVSSMQGVNDLARVRVDALRADEAAFLARCLILGSPIETADDAALAAAMADACGGGAFALHHVAARLAARPGPVGPGGVEPIVAGLLADPDDPLDYRHYRDRLPDYYGPDAGLARAVLDQLALASDRGLTVDEAAARLAATEIEPRPGRERLVHVIERLERDNSLVRDGTRSRFASPLLRRAWIAIQRLDG
ncbi:MAG: ATP-binding protein [Acidimicrobiales bacterium]